MCCRRVALLAGADVLALFLFATIGRYSHGLSVLDLETLRTADPFIAGVFGFCYDSGICVFGEFEVWKHWVFQCFAGWFLGAYFLGGFGEDGRGMHGLSKGVIATAKSWAVGIPVS